jgi:thiomorpholine-carboxylate dehydrogenase
MARASIYAEIGEIFAGTKPPMPDVTTVFKSVGLAVEDVAAAKLVVEA